MTAVGYWRALVAWRRRFDDHWAAVRRVYRRLVAPALVCRYDHPATDRQVMDAEIDRRVGELTALGGRRS